MIRIDASMSFPYMKENRAQAQGLVVQDYPDALLAASIVISCKLLWGLVGSSRSVISIADFYFAKLKLCYAGFRLMQKI